MRCVVDLLQRSNHRILNRDESRLRPRVRHVSFGEQRRLSRHHTSVECAQSLSFRVDCFEMRGVLHSDVWRLHPRGGLHWQCEPSRAKVCMLAEVRRNVSAALVVSPRSVKLCRLFALSALQFDITLQARSLPGQTEASLRPMNLSKATICIVTEVLHAPYVSSRLVLIRSRGAYPCAGFRLRACVVRPLARLEQGARTSSGHHVWWKCRRCGLHGAPSFAASVGGEQLVA